MKTGVIKDKVNTKMFAVTGICILSLLLSLLMTSLVYATPKTLYVQPYKQVAIGVAPQMVLMVSERSEAQPQFFYGTINGFTFEWGYSYVLNVDEKQVANPPADAASLSWELIKILEKTPVPAGTEFAMRIKPNMLVAKEDGLFSLHGEKDVALRVNAPGDCGAPAGSNPVYATFVFPARATDPLILKDWGVSIDGVTWALQSIDGVDVAAFGVTVEFTKDGVSGFSGVNRFFGPAQMLGMSGWLKVGPLGSTMMAGPPEAMNVEQKFHQALDQVNYFNIMGDKLTLGGEKHTLWLVPLTNMLLKTQWQLTKMGEADIDTDAKVTLTLQDNSASGSSFVNNFSGKYELDGDKITIGMMGLTKMMGEPEEMELEYAYIAALKKAASWKIVNNELSMMSADNEVLLQFAQPVKTADLNNTFWQLAWMGEPSTANVALAFRDNNFGGQSFVNSYDGKYELNGNMISFGDMSTTKMMGEPEQMKLEYAYLDLLKKVTQWKIENDELVLLNAKNAPLLKYSKIIPIAENIDSQPVSESEFQDLRNEALNNKFSDVVNIIPTDIRPVYRDGVWYVGFRTLFVWIGADIRYNEATDTAKAVWGEHWVSATVGAMTARVDESRVALDGRVTKINGKIMVPLTFLTKATGIATEVIIENGMATKIKATSGGRTGYIMLK